MSASSIQFDRLAREDAGIVLISFSSKDWLNQLLEAAGPRGTSPEAIVPLMDNLDCGEEAGQLLDRRGLRPFAQVLRTAKELGARTALVEPYVSTDWNDELAEVYARTFRPPDEPAHRVHFFASVKGAKGRKRAVRYADLRRMTTQVSDAYLGYCVLRPIPAYPVGDTVLRSPRTRKTKWGRFHLVHCGASFDAFVLGNRLEVKGMPFYQQETSVGVCAEADLWMLARLLNRLRETGRYRPSEIYKIAAEVPGWAIGQPRDGLVCDQILGTLKRMGVEATVVYPKPGKADVDKDLIYTCVESAIPVMVGLPEHVALVIGHDTENRPVGGAPDKTLDPDDEPMPRMRSLAEFVDAFYVHDDASGPYQLWKVAETGQPGQKSCFALRDPKHEVDFYLMPLPSRVHLRWDDVTRFVQTWIEDAGQYVGALAHGLGLPWDGMDPREWFRRIYLRRSRRLKQDLVRELEDAKQGRSVRDRDVLIKYICMPMPKYVWVAELSRSEDVVGRDPTERLIRGELIFDSTANRNVPEDALLSFHLEGALYVHGAGRTESTLIYGKHRRSRPYPPLRRATELHAGW